MWLNEYDIIDATDRFDRGDTPNLLAGAHALRRLMEWTNCNSDGWPYWQKPSRAADKLMTLIECADRFDPQDITDAQLKAAYTPIKSFLTKHGTDHTEVWPATTMDDMRKAGEAMDRILSPLPEPDDLAERLSEIADDIWHGRMLDQGHHATIIEAAERLA